MEKNNNIMKIIFVFLCTLLFSCSSSNQTQNANAVAPKLDKEGHRGCRGLMPENTILGFKKAIDLGVTTLEMDAVITKDKIVILSHEPFFNHEITTKADGSFVKESEEKSLNIYEMSFEQTQLFDVGLKIHPRFPRQQKVKAQKPKLSDVVDSAEAYVIRNSLPPLQYNIETKSTALTDDIYHPKPEEFVELIMAVILEKKIENRVIIQSFDIRTLQYLNKKYPFVKTAYLYEPPSIKSFSTRIHELGFIPTIYSPDHATVNASIIKECKERGIKIIPWTVNDSNKIIELKNMGVDGIISDYPDLF